MEELDFSEVSFGASPIQHEASLYCSDENASSTVKGSIDLDSDTSPSGDVASMGEVRQSNSNDNLPMMMMLSLSSPTSTSFSMMAPPVLQPLFPSPNMQTFLKMDPLSLPPPVLYNHPFAKSVKECKISRYDDFELDGDNNTY
jgi:hypothetical protein